MSEAGIGRRMSRIFKQDGRALIVAMDHPSFMPMPLAGLDDGGRTMRAVVAGGADAVMVPLGSASAWWRDVGDAGLILSLNTLQPGLEHQVANAVSMGADAVKCMLYPWLDTGDGAGEVSWLVSEARRLGMPSMVETVPGGFAAGADFRTPDRVAAAARIGVELGASMIKTFYPQSPEGMATVTNNCPVPVVILGGEKAADERELLASVADALAGGAQGVAIGRNIWQHPQPQRMTAALAALVHGGATVEQALQEVAS